MPPHPARRFQLPMTASVLFYTENFLHVAHALDFDICAVEKTEREAAEKLRRSLKIHIERGLCEEWNDTILHPAPTEYWDRFISADIRPPLEPVRLEVVAQEIPVQDEFPTTPIDSRLILMAMVSSGAYQRSHQFAR